MSQGEEPRVEAQAVGAVGTTAGDAQTRRGTEGGYFTVRKRRIVVLSSILLFFALMALPRWYDKVYGNDKQSRQLKRFFRVYAGGLTGIGAGVFCAIGM